MLFTIAIPVYNGENTIKNTIESCLDQDYSKEYEILVVDNNSRDNTFNEINKFNHITIKRNKKTESSWKNHNICLDNAKGEYVLFCHADDVLKKEALSILDKKIEERNYPKEYIIWGRSKFRDFFNKWEKGNVNLNNILSGEFALKPFFCGGLTPSGTCYSKESFLKLNGFLNTKHESPSDRITMLYLAYYGFEFEMIDRLYFNREFASTVVDFDYKDIINGIVDALNLLKERMNRKDFENLMQQIFKLDFIPVLFISSLIKVGFPKKNILKYLTKKAIKNPKLFIKYIISKKHRYLVKLLFIG